MNTIRMSNSLDPDHARRFVRPDLGPNCLPRISADDTGRQSQEYHILNLNPTKMACSPRSSLNSPRVHEKYCMLNSTEHESYSAHKC